MGYICGLSFSHKKREILPFATIRMDPEGIKLSEHKSDGERKMLYDLIY